jgi:hypothetical protein
MSTARLFVADHDTEPVADQPTQIDREGAVTVAYVHSRDVAYSWHHSMIEMIGWDINHQSRIMRGGYVAYKCGTDGLVDARNKAVKLFLEEQQADWLFWVDTDMGFEPSTLDRLFDAADPVERPVVGALAFTQREETSDGMGGWRCRATPTVFDWTVLDTGEMGFSVRWDYPPATLVRCAGTGSACVLIHRSVFERIEEKYGPSWYDRVPNTTMGQIVSEDLSLCLRAGTLNIPIHVHTGVQTSHQKALWLAETDYFGQVALARIPPKVPAATEPVAVIVPAMRYTNADWFMTTLTASTGLATVYAVAGLEELEAAEAWKQAGAQVLTGDVATFAERMNLGYRETTEPWLFLTGDDVRFESGWLNHAQYAARGRVHVVGTNDLGNPRVTSGEHATHMLVRRSYVDEVGASWDGPGNVAHEGYWHWFVDDEIVTAAKQRGVWAYAPNSVVEHLHPLFGKGANDDVYRLGQVHVQEDEATFAERVRANSGDAS